jgi:hypothetical protein
VDREASVGGDNDPRFSVDHLRAQVEFQLKETPQSDQLIDGQEILLVLLIVLEVQDQFRDRRQLIADPVLSGWLLTNEEELRHAAGTRDAVIMAQLQGTLPRVTGRLLRRVLGSIYLSLDILDGGVSGRRRTAAFKVPGPPSTTAHAPEPPASPPNDDLGEPGTRMYRSGVAYHAARDLLP